MVSILLDTNIISDINNGIRETIAFLESVNQVFTSSIVAGELFYGIENSTKREANLGFYRDFFRTCTLLDVTIETAEIDGIIKAGLRRKGKPIPENDIWIAAVAMQHGLLLVTHDIHFKHVENLSLKLL